ncbi:hypothetical protein [Enterococcus sp. AZ126]|uniref:hypothetical protein n=1 Tax=Enterococcus sp. AZ126 TaxID=2774635 RepID=UPI003F2090D1
MKRKYVLFLTSFIALLSMIIIFSNQSDDIVKAKSEDQVPVQTSDEAKEAQQVLEENLRFANEKDVTGYVQTLIPQAREDTAKEMNVFFEEFDVENTLQSFEMLKLKEDHMLVETKIKTINKGSDKKQYRDHVATANQTFVYQDGQWLIEQTVMIKTDFIH